MPIISSVKPQKSKKPYYQKASTDGGRVNIYLDGKFGFGLDLENYVKLGLKVGQGLSEERIVQITNKAEFQKVLDRLLFFATLRPRSEREVKNWMVRKKVKESIKKDLIDKIRDLKLLDDLIFAKWWVGQRLSFKNKSLKDLNSELRSKGINREIIDKVLSEADVDEEKTIQNLLEKKGYRWKGLGKLDRKKKMSEFLARKGFKWENIRKVIGRD